MTKNDNIVLSQLGGLIFVGWGLLQIINDQSFSGPIVIALGLITTISATFKSKKYCNRTIYAIIVVVILAMMLIGEYFLAPTKNMIFYILLAIMAVPLFISAYFFLIPDRRQNKKEKILARTGITLFLMIFFLLVGVIDNDFTFSIIGGVFTLVIIGVVFLIPERD